MELMAYMLHSGKIKEKTGIRKVISTDHVPLKIIQYSTLISNTEHTWKIQFIKLSQKVLSNFLKELSLNVHFVMVSAIVLSCMIIKLQPKELFYNVKLTSSMIFNKCPLS